MNFIRKIFTPNKRWRKGVFMVVYRKAKNGQVKYLVQKRKLHWKGYEFPKGGLESGESKLEGVRRELAEETGLPIIKLKNHHRSGRYPYGKELKDRPGIIGQTWSLYSAEVGKGKVKLDKLEHSSSEWLSFGKAFDKLTWDTQKDCLRIVDSWLRK